MTISIRKIEHREAVRIGIFFEKNYTIQQQLKTIDAVYSKTFQCWYIDYSKVAYQQLKALFPDLQIQQPVAGETSSRDLPPTATSDIQLGLPPLNNPEHKVTPSLQTKLQPKLLNNIGKYWVLKLCYHQIHLKNAKGKKTASIYTHLTKSAVDKIKSPLDIMVDENNRKKLE